MSVWPNTKYVMAEGYWEGRVAIPLGRFPLRRHYRITTTTSASAPRTHQWVCPSPIEGSSENRYVWNPHQQAGLAAGTIANDDEFASDLGHLAEDLVMDEWTSMEDAESKAEVSYE